MKRMCKLKPRTICYPALFIVCLFAFQSCAKAISSEELCLSFLEKNMMAAGGVFTNYLTSDKVSELAAGHSVLLESQGLILSYYADKGSMDKADKTLAFIKEKLDSGKILSYRLNEDGYRYSVNAAVDDLRVILAMLDAADSFSRKDYREQAAVYANRLYETNVKDNALMDFYDEQYGVANAFSTLCYPDLFAMQQMASLDERWTPVAQKMQSLMLGGYLGDAFPMYQTRYNWESKAYETERINMVESLLTMYHLSLVKICPKMSLDYLKNTIRNGKLYAVYNTDGIKQSDMESTAVYALCALIAASEKDEELYRTAIECMLHFQVTDEKSLVYGAFADAETLSAYSFDNLMALLALKAGDMFPGSL